MRSKASSRDRNRPSSVSKADEDVEPVCGAVGFHQASARIWSFEQRTIGPFQLHGRAGVEVNGHRLGAALGITSGRNPDGFGKAR